MTNVQRSCLCVLLITTLQATQMMGQRVSAGNGAIRVMTYNVDEGTDYIELQQATTTSQFLVAVGETISAVRLTDPPARMQAVAQQIMAAAPTLVSLQEVDQWYSGIYDPNTGTCGPLTLEFDMLQELTAELASLGGHYEVAVQATQYAFPPTPGFIAPNAYICVQVFDYNVILARTDLGAKRLQWNNPQSGHFANILYFNTPIGVIPLPRVWASVDATFNGKAFRFIGTHLESIDPGIQELQGGELRAGPANTTLPVIVAMDSNAQAAPLPQSATYLDFMNAGYADAWSEVYPLVSGFTCCQAPLVNNPTSELCQRIDLILTLGNIQAQSIGLYGATTNTQTPDGLWPSDHAGVEAQVVVETI